MTKPLERLIQLIEYAKESAKLKANPPLHVTQHKQFARFEERVKGLPGLTFNNGDDLDEVWGSFWTRYSSGGSFIPRNGRASRCYWCASVLRCGKPTLKQTSTTEAAGMPVNSQSC